MSSFLLSFEMDEDQKYLSIHGDEVGLRRLSEALLHVVAKTRQGQVDSDELKTPRESGLQLSNQNKGGEVFNKVKIYCWKDAPET